MDISRKQRKTLQKLDQRLSRQVNGKKKIKERARRDNRLVVALKKGQLPYTPIVMSWLSHKLNKPSKQITQADVSLVLSEK
ncbi:MAG: hypothetical protein EXR99_11995 [Gemmataceae bacterium]|nr:hypothetical protein [Gemmataceae bacterium]